MLAKPLNVGILDALRDGSTGQGDLLRTCGSPSQSTLRSQLRQFVAAGTIGQHRRNRFPGTIEYELAAPGRDLLDVADVVERWLARAPEGPLALGSGDAKAAIRALADGWSSTMLRAIASGPRALTELDALISSLNYPALERRLTALRMIGLVAARNGDGRGTPYGATGWLRSGIAPLVAALRWEQRHRDDAPPVRRLDVEAAFLLSVPLIRLPADLEGTCRMSVELPQGSRQRFAGVLVEVATRSVASCATGIRGEADAWAAGSVGAWVDGLIDGDLQSMELGGDGRLARTAVDGLRRALFGQAGARAG